MPLGGIVRLEPTLFDGPVRQMDSTIGGDDSVLNGLMRGAGEISNQPAVVEAPAGRGRLVLFATNPCYRWQNHGEFGMLFNTILHWNDLLASKAPPAPEKPAVTEP